MSRHLRTTVACLFAATASLVAGGVRGDAFFVDTFNGPDFVPELEDVESAYSFSGGSVAPNGRNYVRTVSAGYSSVDFVAELLYTLTTGDGPAGVFFGLGPANKNANFFDEPYPAIFVTDHASDFVFTGVNIRRWTTDGSEIMLEDVFFLDELLDYSGLALARMTKVGNSLTFATDLEYDGVTFSPHLSHTVSLSGDASFLDGSNTHIFFGTDTSPTLFHNFEVRAVPEPCCLSLSLVLLTPWRRQRSRASI